MINKRVQSQRREFVVKIFSVASPRAQKTKKCGSGATKKIAAMLKFPRKETRKRGKRDRGKGKREEEKGFGIGWGSI